MFGAHEEGGTNYDHSASPDDTIIGSTIKIEGDLVSNGNIIVEGEVLGSLKTEKTLRVGEGAKVKADVKAADVFVSGEIIGNLDVSKRIDLAKTARVTGDIKAQIIEMAAGAVFNGRVTMEGGVTLNDSQAQVDSADSAE